MQTNLDMLIGKDFPETMLEVDHYTKNKQNRNVLDVAKAQNTVNSSAQQKTALARKCYKKGHYTSYCFSKDVSLLSEDNNTESKEDAFLGSLESHGDTQWHATVSLNQKKCEIQIRHWR